MNREKEEAIIEKLKTTCIAFGFLPKEEQEILYTFANEGLVGRIGSDGVLVPCNEPFRFNEVYRLAGNFKSSEQKFFYSNVSNEFGRFSGNSLLSVQESIRKDQGRGWVEVPIKYIKYVRDCIGLHNKGEFDLREYELRQLVAGKLCTWIQEDFKILHETLVVCSAGKLRFVKKPAAQEVRCDFCSTPNNSHHSTEWEELFNNGEYRLQRRVK